MELDARYSPAPDLLAGRVVLITGAGDGLGRAAALACAAHGATVVLLGRTVRKLERTYDAIAEAGGPQAAIYPMNLEGAAPKDYQDLAGTLGTEFGRLDGLVHNAGMLGVLTPLDHFDVELWFKVVQVNLNAPFLLTRACLPLLRTAPDAAVVFLADRVGTRGRAYWGAYAASKAGAAGLMQVLADELEANTAVRVNGFDPGVVDTALRRQAYPGENPRANPRPESVMPGLLYLLGPDSRGVSGQICTIAAPA